MTERDSTHKAACVCARVFVSAHAHDYKEHRHSTASQPNPLSPSKHDQSSMGLKSPSL